jgi:hypothetical protein
MKTSLEVAILSILLEAEEENLPTIVNTLRTQYGEVPPQELLIHARLAIDALEKQGYAKFAWYRNDWVPLSEDDRRRTVASTNGILWDQDQGRWHWNKDLGSEMPILILTDKGKQYIRSLLPILR